MHPAAANNKQLNLLHTSWKQILCYSTTSKKVYWVDMNTPGCVVFIEKIDQHIVSITI